MIDKKRNDIFWVIALALSVRIIHLISSVNNPMTYKPGPDEAYYLSFAKNVMQGQFALSNEYISMDPLYGYLLGLFTWIFGQDLYFIYLIQIIIDIFTVWIVYKLGTILWNKKAGLISALLYALTSSAIFYTTTILKVTLVANYIGLWVLLTIKISKSNNYYFWIGYGFFLGLGVALRSNLLLLSIISLFLLPILQHHNNPDIKLSLKLIILLIGFSLPVSMLGVRNHHISNHWSLLPPNSGGILYSLYNPNNPKSKLYQPEFVAYNNPPGILAGYTNEANRRLNKTLSAYEVNEYWGQQAFEYLKTNPVPVLEAIFYKFRSFISFKDFGDNRLLSNEKQFSPILKLLPNSYSWLFVLGFPGLMLLTMQKKINSLPIILAIVTVSATFIFLVATSRFRVHGFPLLAVGTGIFLTSLPNWKSIRKLHYITTILASLLLSFLTIWSSYTLKIDSNNNSDIAWGYLKMGRPDLAEQYANKQIKISPNDANPYELLGYIAINDNRYEDAISLYNISTKLAPSHHMALYNLALSYSKTGNLNRSLTTIERAVEIKELPEYIYLKAEILELTEDKKNAIKTYERLIDKENYTFEWKPYRDNAQKRLDFLKKKSM